MARISLYADIMLRAYACKCIFITFRDYQDCLPIPCRYALGSVRHADVMECHLFRLFLKTNLLRPYSAFVDIQPFSVSDEAIFAAIRLLHAR